MSKRPVSMAVGALVLSLASPTLAQTPEAAPADAPATTTDPKTAAREQFKTGNDLYDAEKYEEALAAFKESYRAVPSPNSRLMIGRALLKLGRLDEAYSELERTQREATELGEKYQNAREAATHDLGVLQPQLGMLTIRFVDAPEGTLVTIRNRDFLAESLAGPVAVLPGQVTVVAMADGRTVSAVTEVAAGGQGSVDIVMTPPPPKPVAAPPPTAAPAAPPPDDGSSKATLRTAAFIAGGVGVAGLATFGIFGALNQSKFSDLEDGCPGGVCPPELEGDIDTGRTYQTVANIGLVVGLVGVASGATLFVLSSGGDGDSASRSRLEVAGGLGSVQVKGAF